MTRDTLSAMRALAVASAALGLAPFRVDRAGVLRRSARLVLWTGVVATLHAAGLTAFVYEQFVTGVGRFSLAMECIFVTVGSAIIFWTMGSFTTVMTSTWCNLYHVITRVDELLRDISGINASRRRILFAYVTILVVLFSCETIAGVFCWEIFWCARIYYPLLLISHAVVYLQYIMFVLLIKDRYHIVNEMLKSSEDLHGCKENQIVCPHHISKSTSKISSENSSKSSNSTKNVIILQEAHHLLSDAILHVNSIYGFPILLLMCFIWLEVVTGLVETWNSYRLVVSGCLAVGANALKNFGTMLTICWACEETMTEARRTGRVLSRLMLKFLPAVRSEQFKIFQEQLRATKVAFTACGFFHVGLKFLFAFFGTMVGYVVLFMQLDAGFKS